MALRLAMNELVKATLPQGLGRACFIGVAPDGLAWHRLGPLDMDQAQALISGGPGRPAGPGGPGGEEAFALDGRPGWRYLLCRPYNPPPPTAQGPASAEAFRAARLAQARDTARRVREWALRQGWWVEIE
jgi:hypothetical protein